MRSDRRSALLTVIGAIAAIAIGASAVLLPAARGGLLPPLSDVLVGWTLLGGAVLIVRFRVTACLMAIAGVLWILTGLSPYVGEVGPPLSRAALAPTALVAIIVVSLPRQLPRTRLQQGIAALAIVGAVVGGLGYPRGTVLVIGLGVLAVASATRLPLARATQAGVGTGLTIVGLWGTGYGSVDAATVANLHDVTLVAGSIGSVWTLLRTARLALPRTRGHPRLDALLAESLGEPTLTVCFPSPWGWLDETGAAVDRPEGGASVTANGATVAWIAPIVRVERPLRPTLARILSAAGERARLRTELLLRAEEIAASRNRLVTAAAEERGRLAEQLRAGPLRRLLSAAELAGIIDRPLHAAFDDAGSMLVSIADGLDPVVAAGGLHAALIDLCGRSGAGLDWRLTDAPEGEVARTIWFVCSECLANALKHAAGSNIRVVLSEIGSDIELTIGDQGTGRADPEGSGLTGLRDRATSMGGRLTIASGTEGTTVRLTLSRRSFAQSNDVFPLMRVRKVGETVST